MKRRAALAARGDTDELIATAFGLSTGSVVAIDAKQISRCPWCCTVIHEGLPGSCAQPRGLLPVA